MATANLPELPALLRLGWTLRYGAPLGLDEVVPALHRLAEGDPLVRALASVFDGHHAIAAGDGPRLRQALADAERDAEEGGVDARAALLELRAVALSRAADFAAASEVLAPAVEWVDGGLAAPLAFAVTMRQGLVLERLGRFDDALRVQYRAIAAARRAGWPALLSTSLGSTGGLQSSMLNLDDALPLCREAWALCAAEPWPVLHSIAGTNLLMSLSGLGRHDEAVPLAEHLLALDDTLPGYSRSPRLFLIAQALARAGQVRRAQQSLDRGRALAAAGPPRAEWAWTQAALCNQRGESAEALRIVHDYLASDAPAHYGADYPIDTALLQAEAGRACEALGDVGAALRHERQAGAAREAAQRQAAYARRLTLQIEYELDTAHRQRDAAVQEQARLAELNAALEAANRSKTRFLAAASHDLRQPVHALGLQTAALRRELASTPHLGLVAGIERCVDAMASMFDILLDLSRVDAGALEPHWQRIDLADTLLRLVDELAPAAEAKGLRLAVRIAGGGRAATRSDPALLDTLLRNLLTNAIKYTEAGAVLVCARRWHDAARGAQWRLQVWDTGIGIAPADAPRVFDEFYQVGNPARRREHGLGLGLAIVQRLARLLDHPIGLRSVPGRGSCFELRVPALAPDSRPAPPQVEPMRLAGVHVLVIEDDPDGRAALTALLQQWGCAVSAGESADEVLALLSCPGAGASAGAPGALLADFSLPGDCHGAEEVHRVRSALGFELPALVITGDLSPATLDELARRGLPWLPKPLAVHRLVAWLVEAMPAAPDDKG